MANAITIDPIEIMQKLKAAADTLDAIVKAAGPLISIVELTVPGSAPGLKIATDAITIIESDGPAIAAAFGKLVADVEAILNPSAPQQ